MRLNARVGGATRPSRPGRSLTGRPGGVPNRPPQGIFWPSEYGQGAEPTSVTEWFDALARANGGVPTYVDHGPRFGVIPDWTGWEGGATFDLPSVSALQGAVVRLFMGHPTVTSVPDLRFDQAEAGSQLFADAWNLESVGILTFPVATSVAAIAYDALLVTSGGLDAPHAEGAQQAFSGCSRLQEVGPVSLPAAFSVDDFFSGCLRLERVESINVSSAQSAAGMFFGCAALGSIPPLDLGGVEVEAGARSMFDGCSSLTEAPLRNLRVSLDMSDTALSPEAADVLMEGCQEVTGQTLTLPESARGCDVSIAEGKGWQVALPVVEG